MPAGGGGHLGSFDEEKTLGVLIEVLGKDVAALEQHTAAINGLSVAQARHTAVVKEHTVSERDLSREAGISARAMGELGAKGGEMAERFTNLTTAAGGLQGTLLGLGLLGLGGVIEGTRKVIEDSEKHERAIKDLEQAYMAAGKGIGTYESEIDDWLNTNRKFIADQEQAREGFAMMTRAGLDQDAVLRAMNISLDLAALKHISLEDASRRVLLGLEGNARGLKELGIQLKDIEKEDDNAVAAHKKLEEANKKVEEATRVHDTAVRHLEEAQVSLTEKGHKPTHEQLMKLEDEQKKVKDASDDLTKAQQAQKTASDQVTSSASTQAITLKDLEEKTRDGRAATTELEKSQNDLNRAMQDFGIRVGPIVAESLAQDIEWLLKAGGAVQALTGWWQGLGRAASEAHIASEAAQTRLHQGGRQFGGPVFAGSTYTVGEGGVPETLTLFPGGGGYVTAGAGEGPGSSANMDDTNELLAAIHQVLVSRLQPAAMSTRAYTSRS